MEYVPVIQLKQEVVSTLGVECKAMTSTSAVAEFAREYIGDNDRETLIVIGINTKSSVNFISVVSVGSLNATIATPREIFKTAMIRNCSRIVLAHNHPSYDVAPSQADIEFTRRIEKSGDLVGIELLDHVIVSPTDHYSFLAEGLLNHGGMLNG